MNTQPILEIQQEIIKEFESLDDWTDRYKHIIALGKKVPDLKDEFKVDQNIVKGCQSRVWLHAELTDEGTIEFFADSDAAIVRGLIALLVRFYSGQKPDTILSTPPAFIQQIGMDQHLSMTRSNGLASMVKQMKIYALAYRSKLQASS